MTPRSLRLLWLGIAALHLPAGAVAYVDPSLFSTSLASFGPAGPHYVRDLGAAQLVLGGAAAVAAFRPAVRRLVVALLTAHLVLHAISHLVDARLGTAGSTTSLLLALGVEGALLAVVARRSAPDEDRLAAPTSGG